MSDPDPTCPKTSSAGLKAFLLSSMSSLPGLNSLKDKSRAYAPLLSDKDDDVSHRENASPTSSPSLPSSSSTTEDYDHLALSLATRRRRDRTVKFLAGLNVALAFLLAVAVISLWRERARETAGAPVINSPAREAVRYVEKRFGKDDRFYTDNETSLELDALWTNYTGPSEGQFKVDAEQARELIPTVEIWFDLGKYDYGLSVFHQVHCLDVIRRAFYPEHYFPKQSPLKVRQHKQHCLDYLRQAIMCSGDVTVDHWFNYSWTDPSLDPWKGKANLYPRHEGHEDEGGQKNWMDTFTDEYKRATPWQRARQGQVMWDTVHQCRDYDSLWSWVKEREMFDQKYRDYKASHGPEEGGYGAEESFGGNH